VGHPTKEVAAALWTDAVGRNEKLAAQGEKGTSRTDDYTMKKVIRPSFIVRLQINNSLAPLSR
jgi:hypothetical protein